MLPLLIMALLFGQTFGHDDTSYMALKFGADANSYVSFSRDMAPFQNTFSICSWVKRLRSHSNPIWFSYGGNAIIRLDDRGYYSFFNSGLDLQSKFAALIAPGQFYHMCISWSYEAQLVRAYVHGELVSTMITPSGSRLPNGRTLYIGNYSPGHSQYFGGELHNLNIFNKVLSASEVRNMAARGICSEVDTAHDSNRILTWQTILKKPRSGNVREFDTHCKFVHDLAHDLNETKKELGQTESRLNETLDELEGMRSELQQTKRVLDTTTQELSEAKEQANETALDLTTTTQKLEDTEQRLDSTTLQLNTTIQELDNTKQRLNSTIRELEEATKQLGYNTTECLEEKAGLTQWDLLYTKPYLNNVLTKELYAKLSSSWDSFEDVIGVKITPGLIHYFKVFQKTWEEACETDGGT